MQRTSASLWTLVYNSLSADLANLRDSLRISAGDRKHIHRLLSILCILAELGIVQYSRGLGFVRKTGFEYSVAEIFE